MRFKLGEEDLIIQTGELAKQSNGSVLVQYGGTVVLVTVTASFEVEESMDFLPLFVDYKERTYAAGKIPGGFFKREGRPREKEVLTSRLIDRSVRPLFPKQVDRKIQIIAMVLSSDQENNSDIPAIIGSSIALGLSDIPFGNLIGAVRIGRIDGNLKVNPLLSEMENSDLDIIVTGTKESIVMVEGITNEVPEEDLFKALELASSQIKVIVEKEEEFVKEHGEKKIEFKESNFLSEEDENKIKEFCKEDINNTALIKDGEEREKILEEIKDKTFVQFKDIVGDNSKAVSEIVKELLSARVRNLIIDEGIRLDGRKPEEIRPITCKVGLLPCAHGSGLFTRGQTQALAVTTLGTSSDKQIVDGLEKEYKKRFMLHYNFLSFSTGEVKPDRGPGRREIGHGILAERSLTPVLPSDEKFPYTIRLVSDILESNGSSSMASVCGGSLSLMDAGVPISGPVAGVAMGLIKEGEKFKVLTDIQGLEDHLGDMDFKLAGSRKGVTALQMDIKIKGVSLQILKEVIQEAKNGRLFILGEMEQVISDSRKEVSPYAPKISILQINPEKIRTVIGAGGKTIRKITEETNVEINIDDDGKIFISATEISAVEKARKIIEDLTAEVEVGKVYRGKVMRIVPFGAFVEVLPGQEGLVHISQLDKKRVNKVEDILKEGEIITVKVMEVDKQGRINLSRKAVLDKQEKIN
ncbi:polyribonucleotide nucleotidyltransferase [bacterium]|nr:polyribonucleotide nucleotidyltransferase [bacterium]